MSSDQGQIGSWDLNALIPHRSPFLLIDKLVELEPGVRAVAIKRIIGDEYFFPGHFPGNPIMPGVLMVEALAQTGACALMAMEANKNKLAMFAGIDNIRFRRPVTPGDLLKLEVSIDRMRGPIGKGTARASVDNELAVDGVLMFAITNA